MPPLGITRSDLLVINKIDLAPLVGASLEVMDIDTRRMRKERPFVFANMKTGQGVDDIIAFIEREGMLSHPLSAYRQGVGVGARNNDVRPTITVPQPLKPKKFVLVIAFSGCGHIM